MFIVRDEWEDKLFSQEMLDEGTKIYKAIHISTNTGLYHLDILAKADTAAWNRYILDNIRDVINVLKNDCYEKVNLCMQTHSSFNDDEPYELKKVLQLLKIKYDNNTEEYLFKCNNGLIYIFNTGCIDLIADSKVDILGEYEILYSTI